METTNQERITGDEILRDGRGFNTRFLYMTEEMHDALILFEVASHVIDACTTVPRGLAVAPKKQSGKSTLLKSVVMLGWNAWKADPTSYALRSKFNERTPPLVLIDEISEYYGKNGMRQGPKDLNKILLEGYENDAKLSLSVDRVAEDVSCYCMAAMGGLRAAVRDDIFDRSIVWKMKPVPYGVEVEDALSDDIKLDGRIQNARIHQWAREHKDEIKDAFRNFRRPHRKMVSRLRQIWGPLYAVALVAGGDWPERCVAAFKVMALDASEMPVLTGEQRILRDVARQFGQTGADRLFTRDIAAFLRTLPVEDDDDYYNGLTDRGLAVKITAALGEAQSMDIGTQRARGYHAGPVTALWKALEARLDPIEDDEEDDDEFGDFFDVTEITSENPNENAEDSQEAAAPSRSRSSRKKIDEPELSLIDPPCNQDAAPRRRRKQTVEDRFRIERLKDTS